jgi:hypothetical protein
VLALVVVGFALTGCAATEPSLSPTSTSDIELNGEFYPIAVSDYDPQNPSGPIFDGWGTYTDDDVPGSTIAFLGAHNGCLTATNHEGTSFNLVPPHGAIWDEAKQVLFVGDHYGIAKGSGMRLIPGEIGDVSVPRSCVGPVYVAEKILYPQSTK